MYFIHKIKKFTGRNITIDGDLLPSCEFVLTRKSSKIAVTGFLPLHHSHIGYELIINEKNQIIDIISIKTIEGKKPTLSPLRSYKYPNYEAIATQALTCVELLVCSVIYPIWDLRKMNIKKQYEMLCVDIERSAIRGFPYARNLYNYDRALTCIQQAYIIMNKTPFEKIDAFKARMKWQKQTQYDTATVNKPKPYYGTVCRSKDHVKLIEYNGVFCTESSVNVVKKLASVFTPNSTKLIQGSLPLHFTGNIVVLNIEDAYRVRYHTGTASNIYMMTPHLFKPSDCRNLGITNVKQLPKNLDHINVAFAHLWGVEEWTELISFEASSYTVFGRLDQYPRGRGQFFRDMLESNQFSVQFSKHFGTDNIISLQSNDIAASVAEIYSKYDTVQCFNTNNISLGIDCGRRILKKPRRIRSLRDRSEAMDVKLPYIPLIEERHALQNDFTKNASEIKVSRFAGVPVHAGVLICSANTTAFDIAIAKSHCHHALYLINGSHYFSMHDIKPRSRCTANPFLK